MQVNSNPTIPVILQVGAVSETVEVAADAAMVETRSTGVVLGDTYLISANTILSTHATANRTRNNRVVDPYFSPADLGIQVYTPLKGFTGVSVTGNGFAIGEGATNPGYFNSTNYQLAEDLDLIRGAHQVAIGVNFIHNNVNTSNNRPTNGQFTFNGQVTGLPLADFNGRDFERRFRAGKSDLR